MWLGMVVGGGLGWAALQGTSDGSLARFLVDDRTAWMYVAALTALLAVGVAAAPRAMAGGCAGLAVGLGMAAFVTLRPEESASAWLGAPLGVAAAIALAGALLGSLVPAGDHRHPVRRPWSRRARRDHSRTTARPAH